jgi:hypothetical protein
MALCVSPVEAGEWGILRRDCFCMYVQYVRDNYPVVKLCDFINQQEVGSRKPFSYFIIVTLCGLDRA